VKNSANAASSSGRAGRTANRNPVLVVSSRLQSSVLIVSLHVPCPKLSNLPRRKKVPATSGAGRATALLGDIAAIDQMVAAGDEGGPPGQQEASQGRYLFGGAEPLDWMHAGNRPQRRRVKIGREQWRVDKARAHGVDPKP